LFLQDLCVAGPAKGARSWEQEAKREDRIDKSERHRLVNLFFLLCTFIKENIKALLSVVAKELSPLE
jgi:hypothetical protein